MWKRLIIPLIFCILFVVSTVIFWYLLKGFYDEPFIWTRFNNDFNFKLIPLGFNLVIMIFFSSLLTLVKPRSHLVYGVYIAAAVTFIFFLPITILTIGAAVLFAVGFIFFEWSTNKLFHSFVKIDFWDTYTKTIPTLITFLTVVMALMQYQASIDNLKQLKITIPRMLIEKAFVSVSGDDSDVKGAHTYIAQTNTDSPEVNDLINKQLEQFGITDPKQQELFREQVKQQLGIAPLAPSTTSLEVATAPAGLSDTTTKPSSASSLFKNIDTLPGISQIKANYKDQLVNQLKQQLEDQVNQLIAKYSMYIPALNAVAIFFLLSILNLPVMLLSIALVAVTMNTLRMLKIITVVKVKTEVERFAW